MKTDFRVEGLSKINDLLKQLPQIAQKRVGQSAMRIGANIIKKAAQDKVPERSGELKKSIVVKQDRYGSASINYTIGIEGKARSYAHLVEFGAAPHVIRPDKKKALSNGRFFVEEIHHPGASAKPFLRPAFDNHQEEVIKKIGQVLGKGVEREALRFVNGK